jgi:imidazolonepropionase
MKKADFVVAGCRQIVTCGGGAPKRKEALAAVDVIEDGWLAASAGRIVFAGPEAAFRTEVDVVEGATRIDGGGLVALPGFVDAHNHLPFAGDRAEEFSLRLRGWTYQQLAEKGLGIKTTVGATRRATLEELTALCLERLDRMLLHGTTTAEAKSGYGLNLADEIKQLEAVRAAGRVHPVELVATFMGAHDVPVEYLSKKEDYIDLLVHEIMPEIRRRNLARFFDVFCEKGVYTLAETERLVQAAGAAGFGIKIHADEFVPLGGTELAAAVGAVSAEHLIAITDAGIRALAASGTVAVILPGVPFFLRLASKAPARRLIEAGAIVALATDFNPGTSMTESMLFILQLGVFTHGLSIEEALNAATINGACALRLQGELGSLEIGKKMDTVLCDLPSYEHLAYHLGINPVKHVIKSGRLVVEDGRTVYSPLAP